MKRLILAALAVFAIVAMPALASPVRTLSISPDPAHAGDHLFFSGCGYGQNKALSVWAEAPGSSTPAFVIGVRADSVGCFTTVLDSIYAYDGYLAATAGTYGFYVFYKHGSGVSDYGNGQPVADVDVEVLP